MTTTYTFDQLKEDVRKEAEALRVHATQEERGRLDIYTFNDQDPEKCIYGQCTGSCVSPRAHELMSKCCQTYINNEAYAPYDDEFKLKREYVKDKIESLSVVRSCDGIQTRIKWLSAIEAYILLPEAKNANLISYLRGETETLDL